MDPILRQRLIFSIAGCLVLLAGYQWLLKPALDYRREIRQEQRESRQRLEVLQRLKGRYVQAKQGSRADSVFGEKQKGFTLFSYLERRAAQAAMKENIEFMRPSSRQTSQGFLEQQVELRLDQVRLAKLIDFLADIESAKENIFLKRLTIRSPRSEPGSLKVDLLAVTYSSVS